MHIPAMDSLHHKRVGIVSNKDGLAVLRAYVKLEDTPKGVYDPIEGFGRPFPLMFNSKGNVTSIEQFVEGAELNPFSDTLIEYIYHLYESMEQGEWVEEVEQFDGDRLSQDEEMISSTLLSFAGQRQDTPQELFRSVYKAAYQYKTDATDTLSSNPLTDIAGHKRYDFSYLPLLSDVDDWSLHMYSTNKELEEFDQPLISESLWVRYNLGGSVYEKPILEYDNEIAGMVVASENAEFGTANSKEVDTHVIESILSTTDESDNQSYLSEINPHSLEGTRSIEYLKEFIR